MGDWRVICGDAVETMATLPAQSVDAIITDPPYPEIDRPYGRMTEADWHAMMRGVVAEARRVLKPNGSAVFVLQANQERVGRTRPWLWEFMAWTAREWNMVQDAWWWNFTTIPSIHCRRQYGLLRPSVKACIWLGAPDCYRDQDSVLWTESEANRMVERSNRALQYFPSGQHIRRGRCSAAADERGGVTPFNLIPFANSDSASSAGAHGHAAGTPLTLCSWWARYITPPEGTILDPFTGSGTTGVAAIKGGFSFVGIESHAPYVAIAERRLREAVGENLPLFAGVGVR